MIEGNECNKSTHGEIIIAPAGEDNPTSLNKHNNPKTNAPPDESPDINISYLLFPAEIQWIRPINRVSFYKVEPPVFTLPAMGGPSPLWGREVPLFHTQNNTRNLSAGRSPQ
jgi:hypothetical protein